MQRHEKLARTCLFVCICACMLNNVIDKCMRQAVVCSVIETKILLFCIISSLFLLVFFFSFEQAYNGKFTKATRNPQNKKQLFLSLRSAS